MIINSVPSASIAASIWTAATRNLTGLGAGSVVLISQADTTLAAGASLDLRPAAGKHRDITIGVLAGAAAAATISQWNGTTSRVVTSINANSSGGQYVCGNSVVGPILINLDGANALHYTYGGADWTQ